MGVYVRESKARFRNIRAFVPDEDKEEDAEVRASVGGLLKKLEPPTQRPPDDGGN